MRRPVYAARVATIAGTTRRMSMPGQAADREADQRLRCERDAAQVEQGERER